MRGDLAPDLCNVEGDGADDSGNGHPKTVLRPVPSGRFVAIVPEAVEAFAAQHGLDSGERALLEYLLLEADWRTHRLPGFSLTDLAEQLRLGPSGRRSLAKRLDRLAAIEAVAWSRQQGARPGWVQVLAYGRLVRTSGERVGRWVQVLPDSVSQWSASHDLGPTAQALLVRLLLLVDHRSASFVGPSSSLAARAGLTWRGFSLAVDELAAAGAITWTSGPRSSHLQLLVHGELVRVHGSQMPGGDAGAGIAESRAGRALRSRNRAVGIAESRGRPAVLPPIDLVDKNKDLPYEPCRGENDAAGVAGQGDLEAKSPGLWEQLGAAIAPEHRKPILIDPEQAGGRTVAKRKLSELAEVVGPEEAVRQASSDWPEAVLWPMGFLVDRLRRRLAETHGTGLEVAAAESLGRQVDRRRRAGMLAGAANLGRTSAQASLDVDEAEEWIRAKFGGDDEAIAEALQAYTAACAGVDLW
ncbi:MAG TPA: hypothetical protein VGV93_10795 [Acidimicrobiales bacterium]|nr:hypothetical protein [Acidimicrobiales bacterium]